MKYTTRNSIAPRRTRDSMNAPARPITSGTVRKKTIQKRLWLMAFQKSVSPSSRFAFASPVKCGVVKPFQSVNA
jgi:hypothetical protein